MHPNCALIKSFRILRVPLNHLLVASWYLLRHIGVLDVMVVVLDIFGIGMAQLFHLVFRIYIFIYLLTVRAITHIHSNNSTVTAITSECLKSSISNGLITGKM